MRLQDSQEYKDWIDSDRIVTEHEQDETLITVVQQSNGKYRIYRTFAMGSNVAVSVDLDDAQAELVFEYLLRY